MTLSLAGRTAAPAAHAVPVRSGGFGGAEGLARYLLAERIDAVIDATHPYAAVISANAVTAASGTGVPLLAIRRPPWIATKGDDWIEAADAGDAVRRSAARRAAFFSRLGATSSRHSRRRRSIIISCAASIRSIRRCALPHAVYVTARGPFKQDDERALLAAHKIEVIVAKNSGGEATYGKIAAARTLGIAVIILRRPALPEAVGVESLDDALAWLDHALASRAARGE